MTARPPPIPPEQKSPYENDEPREQGAPAERGNPQNPNTAEQARQGNVNQNTTNKGYQQDR